MSNRVRLKSSAADAAVRPGGITPDGGQGVPDFAAVAAADPLAAGRGSVTVDVATPDGDPVTLAYVMHNSVTASFFHSVLQMVIHDFSTDGHIARGGYIAMRCGTGNLVEARNDAVREFLAGRDGEWMFWADTDMGFEHDTVDRLLAVADPVARPIVGALCFTQKEIGRDGYGGWETVAAPTIFDWVKVEAPKAASAPAADAGANAGAVEAGTDDAPTAQTAVDIDPATGSPRGEQQGFAVRYDYTRDAVVQCKGTGSAAVLIHRSVFEKIQAAFGPIWYDRIWNPWQHELTSEDLSFCMRAGTLDIPVFVHTGVRTTHAKTQWVGEDVYMQQRAVVELADHFKSIRRNPAAAPGTATADQGRTGAPVPTNAGVDEAVAG